MAAQLVIEDVAHVAATMASDAFGDLAQYLKDLPADAWDGPTACTKWNVYQLAGHVLGEVVWFPNLTRGVTKGEQPLPNELYTEMKSWPHDRMVERMTEAAASLELAVAEATRSQLEQHVDLGFTKMPLWQATNISALEGVLHNWDARAIREPDATIPTSWAAGLAPVFIQFASVMAHQDGVAGAEGTYLLNVSDGIGPITITAGNGSVTVDLGTTESADVTLELTPEQFVRLIAGRLKVDSTSERDRVTITGDRTKALGLNRIFAGISGG